MSVYDWSASIKITFDKEIVTENITAAGFVVTGFEPSMSPGGALVPTTYSVKRVAKAEDGLSITIYLNLAGRMKYPQGLVTVAYTKTLGNLAGRFSSLVEDFLISFTPTNITPIFNPQAQENISLSVSGIAARHLIHFIDTAANENISLSVSAVAVRYHIDDIEQ